MSDPSASKSVATRPLLVVALGDNALLRRGEALDASAQRHNVEHAAAAIAELAADYRIVVTHGNGPQVGLLALQSEVCAEAPAYPLDVLGAESEGMIGYMLEQALHGKLGDASSCTLLTEVLVDPEDPASPGGRAAPRSACDRPGVDPERDGRRAQGRRRAPSRRRRARRGDVRDGLAARHEPRHVAHRRGLRRGQAPRVPCRARSRSAAAALLHRRRRRRAHRQVGDGDRSGPDRRARAGRRG